MATILSSAIDDERARDIASNAAAMGEPAQMARYIVQIKRGATVLRSFECMAKSSCSACAQHIELADTDAGEYVKVDPVRGAL